MYSESFSRETRPSGQRLGAGRVSQHPLILSLKVRTVNRNENDFRLNLIFGKLLIIFN
jgi:hypothetical protein